MPLAIPVITPGPTVIRPTPPGLPNSVNRMLPSGPVVIPTGARLAVKPVVTPPVNSVTDPSGLTRPSAPGFPVSVNQMLPSGPVVIPNGPRLAVNPVVTPPV